MSNKKDTEDIQQVDTIELGLWIRKTIADWEPINGLELYEYLAEEMKKEYTVVIKSEDSHPDECDCDDL